MTDDLGRLWLATLEQVVSRAAHEVKDALNGVSVNLEVVGSRTAREGTDLRAVAPFARAAADQLDVLGARVEALLYLSRQARTPADVALTLKHLAVLLVPATRVAGGQLTVEGFDTAAMTKAPGQATRLALAAALLETAAGKGSSRCRLASGPDIVARFSHESAGPCSLDPAIASAVAAYGIRTERSEQDLILVFPGHESPHGSTH